MTRLIAAMLCLALVTPARAASPAERAAVMTALLHELAGDQRVPHRRAAGRPICVGAALSAAPIAGGRQPAPEHSKFDAPVGQARLPWRADSEEEARNRLWWIDPGLNAADLAAQRAIQDAALAASDRAPAPPGTIDPAWLASNQSLGSGRCDETQQLSEPDIALNHAFVNVTLNCGALCALDALYVLRHEKDGWKVVGGRIDMIS